MTANNFARFSRFIVTALLMASLLPAPLLRAQRGPTATLVVKLDGASARVQLEAPRADPRPAVEIRLRPWNAPASAPWQFDKNVSGFSGTLRAVLRDEPFAIDVRLNKKGPGNATRPESVAVSVKAPEGGATQPLQLTHLGAGRYASAAPITVASGGGQTRTLLGFEFSGGGLSKVRAPNGGTVTVLYDKTEFEFKVYDTSLERSLGLYNDGFLALRQDLQFRLQNDGLSPLELLAWRHPNLTEDARAELAQKRLNHPGRRGDLEGRLRYIDHYFNVLSSDRYTHKRTHLAFAKNYAGLLRHAGVVAPHFAGVSVLGFQFVDFAEVSAWNFSIREAEQAHTDAIVGLATNLAFGFYRWTLELAGIPGLNLLNIGPGELYMITTGVNPETGKKATSDDYRNVAVGVFAGVGSGAAKRALRDRLADTTFGPERTVAQIGDGGRPTPQRPTLPPASSGRSTGPGPSRDGGPAPRPTAQAPAPSKPSPDPVSASKPNVEPRSEPRPAPRSEPEPDRRAGPDEPTDHLPVKRERAPETSEPDRYAGPDEPTDHMRGDRNPRETTTSKEPERSTGGTDTAQLRSRYRNRLETPAAREQFTRGMDVVDRLRDLDPRFKRISEDEVARQVYMRTLAGEKPEVAAAIALNYQARDGSRVTPSLLGRATGMPEADAARAVRAGWDLVRHDPGDINSPTARPVPTIQYPKPANPGPSSKPTIQRPPTSDRPPTIQQPLPAPDPSRPRPTIEYPGKKPTIQQPLPAPDPSKSQPTIRYPEVPKSSTPQPRPTIQFPTAPGQNRISAAPADAANRFLRPDGTPHPRVRPVTTQGNRKLWGDEVLQPGSTARVAGLLERHNMAIVQSKIYAETVNQYVRDMLEGRFDWTKVPKGDEIKLVLLGNTTQIIQSGHHRMIAALIVHEMTGRPYYTYGHDGLDVDPIIPVARYRGRFVIENGRPVLKMERHDPITWSVVPSDTHHPRQPDLSVRPGTKPRAGFDAADEDEMLRSIRAAMVDDDLDGPPRPRGSSRPPVEDLGRRISALRSEALAARQMAAELESRGRTDLASHARSSADGFDAEAQALSSRRDVPRPIGPARYQAPPEDSGLSHRVTWAPTPDGQREAYVTFSHVEPSRVTMTDIKRNGQPDGSGGAMLEAAMRAVGAPRTRTIRVDHIVHAQTVEALELATPPQHTVLGVTVANAIRGLGGTAVRWRTGAELGKRYIEVDVEYR